MKKTEDNKSRRNFLQEGFKLGAGLIVGTKSIVDETSEKVRLLTSDGRVVEVKSSQIKRPETKSKNKEILDWVENPGIKKSSQ
jgi:hypothetical protein